MTKKNFVMYIVLIFVLVSFAVLILLYPNKQKLNTDVVMLFVINGFITFVL